MSNSGDALEGLLLAHPVEVLRAELEFPCTRNRKQVPQEDKKTNEFEADSSLNLHNSVSGFAFLKQQECFKSVPHVMWFMIETERGSIT